MSTKSFIRTLFFCAAVVSFVAEGRPVLGQGFEVFERGHFIIYHNNRDMANKLSWQAEAHYKRIVSHFGVPDFRPWEDGGKCPVYLYKTREDFEKSTGAPAWAAGLAQYDDFRFSTFEGAPDLFEATLPHEMTHMLLYLFMGEGKVIPLWLNEGLAQFEETDSDSYGHRRKYIKGVAREGKYIGLGQMFQLQSVPPDSVALFYGQAASVVDYLVNDNIRANFGRFLLSIKNGATAEKALVDSFQWKYKNGADDLEKRWVQYVRQRY